MSMEGKTEALTEWAKGWPGIGGYLKLNAISSESGDASIDTVYNDAKVQEYIDGRALREFTFALVLMADWSDGFDSVNAEANRLGESWIDWVDDQFPGNLPNWPDALIQSIESIYNVPSLAAVYQDDSLAKYMFQAKITYIE